MTVIFDTDPGIDDAIALHYRRRLPQIELAAAVQGQQALSVPFAWHTGFEGSAEQ